MILIPIIEPSLETGVQAAATYCVKDTSGRPTAGYILINKNLDFNKKNSEEYYELLFLHEITHVLVFHTEFFEHSSISTGDKRINGVVRKLITSPKVKEAAQKHFGCKTLEGVPLEDQGGDGSSGSHWDSRFMLGDYMISSDYEEIVISDITLALFEDSGWYTVNYYTGGLFKFGKGMGCNFINDKCIEKESTKFHNDFCVSAGKPRCSSSRTNKGICYLVDYKIIISESSYRYFNSATRGGFETADYCPVTIAKPVDKYYYENSCSIGANTDENFPDTLSSESFCVLSSLTPFNKKDELADFRGKFRAQCLKVECKVTEDEDNMKFARFYYDKEKYVDCPPGGGKVTVEDYEGYFMCPDYNLVCTGTTVCNSVKSCIDKQSTARPDSYKYDYFIETDQNIEELEGKGLLSSGILEVKLGFIIFNFIILLLI